jgi:mRNA-degrading endonuclease toxin of MazEF toxin-antitoxin module
MQSNTSPVAPQFPRRGELWLIHTNPITPTDPHLPRPVVIISTNPRNKSWNSVIVIPLSTGLQQANPKFHIAIPAGQGGLKQPSFARCDLVSNIEKTCLNVTQGPIGEPLSDSFLWQIVNGVKFCIGDSVL